MYYLCHQHSSQLKDRSVIKYAAIEREMLRIEQRIKLPLPLLVSCAILLDSLSIWNNRPLNFSTDHLPLTSTSRLNVPDVECQYSSFTWRFTFLTTSLLISQESHLKECLQVLILRQDRGLL